MKCSVCDGEKGWYENYGLEYYNYWEDCPYCKGTGKAGFAAWFWEHAPVRFVEWYADKFCKEDK